MHRRRGPPPPDCTTDDDCAEGEACIVQTFESCTGSGCVCPDDDPSCGCDVPEEEECKSETYAFCAPPWAGGCDVDADCGDGFTCELLQSCACSGSGGDNGPEGDAAPEEACVCEPDTEGSCVLVRVECDSDADCLEGFECQDEGSVGACSVSEDGAVDCDGPAESASICMPPSFGGGTGAENGLIRADDADDEEEEEGLGDDVDARNIFNCAATSPMGALPLVSLALLLRRRRR